MEELKDLFLHLEEFAEHHSGCERRHVGAVIVDKNLDIYSWTTNRQPSHISSCKEKGGCYRIKNNIESGTQHEKCFALHAEQLAILNFIYAFKELTNKSTMSIVITHSPCSICARMISECGFIKEVIFKEFYPDNFAFDILKESGISIKHFKDNNLIRL